ncbi:MAG: hypothetical protein M3T49_03450 [Candidatus Eremiobacteraeota bacterium]|nr:hypothetical protein [Candidatus Eremiobacteraeota bacterium]
MKQAPYARSVLFWRALTAIVALCLYVIADSDTIYEATSPSALSYHVVLRKSYSVVAFALVGFCFAKARKCDEKPAAPLLTGAVVGAFSLAIEITQAFLGPPEGLGWNAADTAMGFVGGVLGGLAAK